MSEAVTFLLPAFAMCVMIALLHVYLGMHILEREVIFVDLSLAQLAALGATVAEVLGLEGSWGTRGASLAFAIGGAALFALTRRARRRISEEAIVGIVYALSSAMMVLVLSRSPHGGEQIKDVLAGSLLVTTWEHVRVAAVVYASLGALQFVFARRFLQLSWPHAGAPQDGAALTAWNFLFYVLFAIAITISVPVAGVLLVFSYLIVPAVITRLFHDGIVPRLVLGWGVALLASVLGLWGSWVFDVPTGAAIVTAFGMLLVLAAMLAAFRTRSVAPAPPRERAE